MLPDGSYEAFVLDAVEVDDAEPGSVRVDITIISGPAKGNVLSVRGHAGGGDAVDLLGVPATLVVLAGEPRLELG